VLPRRVAIDPDVLRREGVEMHDIRRGALPVTGVVVTLLVPAPVCRRALRMTGAVVTLLTPALAAAAAGLDASAVSRPAPLGGGSGARGVVLAGSIDGVRAAAGCASAAFGGPADLLVLVVLVAALARLRPRDRAGVRRGPWTFRGARGWRAESR
jgi:hypothetical protein